MISNRIEINEIDPAKWFQIVMMGLTLEISLISNGIEIISNRIEINEIFFLFFLISPPGRFVYYCIG